MKVIRPIAYQSSMLQSTTATEATAAWSSGTTYAIGNRVISGIKKYESLQNSNTNHTPATSPTWWIEVGSDNRHAMFDGHADSPTTATTTFKTTIVVGQNIDTIAIINSLADTVRVKMTAFPLLGVPGVPTATVVYDQTIGLSGALIFDWFEYFFTSTLDVRTQAIFYGLPSYANAEIEITFTSGTGVTVSAGEVIFGQISELGGTQYGVNAGIIDYSVKTTDAYGNTSLTKRAYSKRLTAKVQLDNIELNRVQTLLYNLRATPTVWIGSDDPLLAEPLILYAFYKDFSTEIAYPTYSLCSLELEGMI